MKELRGARAPGGVSSASLALACEALGAPVRAPRATPRSTCTAADLGSPLRALATPRRRVPVARGRGRLHRCGVLPRTDGQPSSHRGDSRRAEAPRLRSFAPWRSARRLVVDRHPPAVALHPIAIRFLNACARPWSHLHGAVTGLDRGTALEFLLWKEMSRHTSPSRPANSYWHRASTFSLGTRVQVIAPRIGLSHSKRLATARGVRSSSTRS